MNDSICVVARAVIIDEGKILLAYPFGKKLGEKSHFYFLPGGHVEHGENAQDCLLRELFEEIGYIFSITRFLGVLEHKFDLKAGSKYCHDHEYNLVFLATSPSCKARILPPQLENHIYFEWIELNNLKNVELLPKTLDIIIEEWMSENRDNSFRSLIHR